MYQETVRIIAQLQFLQSPIDQQHYYGYYEKIKCPQVQKRLVLNKNKTSAESAGKNWLPDGNMPKTTLQLRLLLPLVRPPLTFTPRKIMEKKKKTTVHRIMKKRIWRFTIKRTFL